MHEQTTNSMISSEMGSADVLFIYSRQTKKSGKIINEWTKNRWNYLSLTRLSKLSTTTAFLTGLPWKETLQILFRTKTGQLLVTQGKRQCGRQCVQNYHVARKRDFDQRIVKSPLTPRSRRRRSWICGFSPPAIPRYGPGLRGGGRIYFDWCIILWKLNF